MRASIRSSWGPALAVSMLAATSLAILAVGILNPRQRQICTTPGMWMSILLATTVWHVVTITLFYGLPWGSSHARPRALTIVLFAATSLPILAVNHQERQICMMAGMWARLALSHDLYHLAVALLVYGRPWGTWWRGVQRIGSRVGTLRLT